MTARQATLLDTAGATVLERVRALLTAITEDETANRADGHGAGCFTVNTITAVASRNPDIARLVEADLQRRLSGLRLTLRDGQLDGSVTADRAPEDLAWYVTSLLYGMRIAAQSGAGPKTLAGTASTGLAPSYGAMVLARVVTGTAAGAFLGVALSAHVPAVALLSMTGIGLVGITLNPAMVPPALRAARVGQEAADTAQERSSGGEGPENILVP
ncbi:hypothetical protein GCM10007079_32310 [Nocardiopsis terrae]|uniref:Tetracyclin repressor-like C-terminal domain-containing protein n=1 Tax=Nocardiopsis terrae TaxID=372655 RepID=A0ABR9HJ69_9ACTN|nr:hypothetical protein [Nocardiopsis terrae]GHC87841.1 hypothetical protein GCM10007079_32310 [Nocardiopsis terrae]